MNVKQLSVFIENKTGRVSEVSEALGSAGVNIRGFSVSDTADYGIVRLVVSDTEKAVKALHDAGFTLRVNEVLSYQLADTPPAPPDLIARVLGQFRDAGCNAR